MRILFLTFYFEPDFCAGSFRNTPLFIELQSQLSENDFIQVVTTQPNRYSSFQTTVQKKEKGNNYEIDRITIPKHKSGIFDQAKAFITYYKEAMKLTKNQEYDFVYASSSRLFTAFLGRRISKSKNIPLYLDIRDIFVDTIKEILGAKKFIQLPIIFILKFIEKYTFKNATHINLVSEGFKEYFKKFPKPTYSYFTNGIDDVFLKQDKCSTKINNIKIITYAGNIGSGQGLEKFIPIVAKELGANFHFRIIGDGGKKALLVNAVNDLGLTNVEILDPVNRDKLIDYYKESDFLLMHLNDLEAFKKVLPSKIFEYATFNKPIIAGVSGYASEFIKKNVDNCILFNPLDTTDFLTKLKSFQYKLSDRKLFCETFTRSKIMKEMTSSILNFREN